jgi:DTW domain-containing protein
MRAELVRHTTEPLIRYRDLCRMCNRSRATCFCKYATSFETNTRFIILMHPKEFKRQRTGTGRVTRLSLVNSEIIVGAEFAGDTRLNAALSDAAYFPLLLFPGLSAIHAGSAEFQSLVLDRRPLVVIIDATWASARKMLRLSPNLQSLPRLTFGEGDRSKFIIKRQPNALALSTIEAAYRLLGELDTNGYETLAGRHHSLMQTLDAIVAFQRECEANPDLPSHRIPKPK